MSFIICTFFCVLVLGQEPLKANERLRQVNSVLLQTLEQLNVQHEVAELTKEEVEKAVGCATTLTSCGASRCPSGYSATGMTRGNSCIIGVQKYCCKNDDTYYLANWSPPPARSENAVGDRVAELTKEEVEKAVGCASSATTLTSCGASRCPSGYSDTGMTRGNSCIIGVQKYCCKNDDTYYLANWSPPPPRSENAVGDRGNDGEEMTAVTFSTCVDQTGWKATSRRGTVYECIDYQRRGWCNMSGVGSKWNADWNWIRGNNGKDARQACCECGGGKIVF